MPPLPIPGRAWSTRPPFRAPSPSSLRRRLASWPESPPAPRRSARFSRRCTESLHLFQRRADQLVGARLLLGVWPPGVGVAAVCGGDHLAGVGGQGQLANVLVDGSVILYW